MGETGSDMRTLPFAVEEVAVLRTEHFAITDTSRGRTLAYTNNGEDARLIAMALNLAESVARDDDDA